MARGLTRFVGREAEFLYETRLFPEHEYTFKHALTHEVAYGSLLQERRRALHARIVEVLEALYVDRQAEQVERLAHHGLRGEVWDKAMAYCRQAGEKAMARSAHREAVGYFEQALSAVPHLLETRNTREQAGEEGLRIAKAVAHPGSLLFAFWGIGLLALGQGDLHRALPLLEHAMRICYEADLPIYFPRMAAALGAAYTLAGRVGDAVPLLTQAVEQTIATEMRGLQALCRLALGEAQVLAGRLEEAHTLAERALALAREHQERGHQAYALRLLGKIEAQCDATEHQQAAAHYRRALILAEELGMRPLVAHCQLGLGMLYRQMGQVEEARAALSTAIELYRGMEEMTFWLPEAEAALAQVT